MVVKKGYSSTYFPGRVSYGLQSRPLAIASQYLPLTPTTPYPVGRGKGKSVLRYNSLQARPPTQIIIVKDLNRLLLTRKNRMHSLFRIARKRLWSGKDESEDSLDTEKAK